MNGGNIISPFVARENANEMIRIADSLQTLLDNVSKKIDEINNEQTGLYQGSRRPAELKEELVAFRGLFANTYGQITKSARDIIDIANTMENE